MERVALVALVALSWWLATLAAVFVSGAFPVRQRPLPLRGPAGTLAVPVLAVTAALLAMLAVQGALRVAAWPYAVIGAGLGALLAPACFTWLPASLADRPLGAALLAVGCSGAAAGWLVAADAGL